MKYLALELEGNNEFLIECAAKSSPFLITGAPYIQLPIAESFELVPSWLALGASDAGRLREIVQRAVDEVDVIHVQAHAAALQQVEEVRPRLLGDFPHGAGLHRDVACFLDVLEDGDGVAGELEDAAQLGERG